MAPVKFQKLRHARHRKFRGLERGAGGTAGAGAQSDPGHPRLNYTASWLDGQTTKYDASGALSAFVVEDAADAQATGVLTLTGNAANAETVTVGSKVYRFLSVLSGGGSPNDVLIGADAAESIDNLIAAINDEGSGEGTTYGNGTTANEDATAAAGIGDTMDLTAVAQGLLGNSVATTETMTNGSFGAATLGGGVTNGACTDAAHGFGTGRGPVKLFTTGTLPAGLEVDTQYWLFVIDANTFTLHRDRLSAGEGTNKVEVTDTGTGVHSTFGDEEQDDLTEHLKQSVRSETMDAESDIDELLALSE